ncbi:hypothetical protein B1H10_02470 [candidate division KSB1 bacterium 4484_188]|nr:MAG: hypothetical protein B1H10_02470 [candidate division KSB1 bacterium 4484_188]
MSNVVSVNEQVIERAKKIRVILMDVDGVMSDGKIVYDSNGVEIKHFDAHDGLGIKLAKLAGLKTGVISARESETIRKRAAELGMDFLYLGSFKKLDAFHKLQKKLNLPPENFCFIGDDLPDIPVLREVGLAIAVGNATEMTRNNVHYTTRNSGGSGAVREAIELILDAQEIRLPAIEKLWKEG